MLPLPAGRCSPSAAPPPRALRRFQAEKGLPSAFLNLSGQEDATNAAACCCAGTGSKAVGRTTRGALELAQAILDDPEGQVA